MAIPNSWIRLPRLVAATAAAVLAFLVVSPASAQDGLYLRVGGGLGYTIDAFESDEVLGASVEGTLSGVALVGELAIGGSLAPGVVLGFGVYPAYSPSPTADDIEYGTQEFDAEYEQGLFTLLGPFIDYYPNPSGRAHLQAGVGYALFSLGDAEVEGFDIDSEVTGGGIGLMLGAGHEWWISEDWSLGVLVRLTIGSTSAEDDNNLDWQHTVFSPALLLTATMN